MGILINGLKLEAAREWIFHPMGQMIIARRDSGIGTFQISLAFRHDVSGKPSSEACVAIAREFVAREGVSEPFDTIEIANGNSFFGGFSYTIGKDFGRVWYNLSLGQLVLAVYNCSSEKKQISEINECEQIIKSAQFK